MKKLVLSAMAAVLFSVSLAVPAVADDCWPDCQPGTPGEISWELTRIRPGEPIWVNVGNMMSPYEDENGFILPHIYQRLEKAVLISYIATDGNPCEKNGRDFSCDVVGVEILLRGGVWKTRQALVNIYPEQATIILYW